MEAINAQRVAVIMGDIVRSEQSLPPERLHERFNRAVDAQNAAYADIIKSPLTITLGDEFQGLVTSLAKAASIARSMRLQLLEDGINCRFVIGTANIMTPINPYKAWNMLGPGLAQAREKLDQKKANQYYRFSLPEAPAAELALDAIGTGLSVIETNWTRRQLQDIKVQLSGLSPADLAKQRNISVHSIYKVRSAGHYDAYMFQWHAILQTLQMIDRQERLP